MNGEPLKPDEDVLCAYLDGECTDAEQAWVEEQLATSEETRAALAEVAAARDAVRALPLRDAPPEFWARLLAADPEPVLAEVSTAAAPADLAEARHRRGPGRWLAAAAGTAAAAVIAAVILVPQPQSVTPPVGAFTDAHAVRSSLQDDAVSTLAPLAVAAGFRR